ncbi:hypothetical protein C0991_000024 [Blastosporella zonata]|nr:hypothetical protein C0991_000024 [Blastosporella zonata]
MSTPSPTQSDESTIHIADELKDQGNGYFRSRQWDEALVAYQSALGHLPRRTENAPSDDSSKAAPGDSNDETPQIIAEKSSTNGPVPQEEPDAIAKRRAILNANIGACYVKLVRTSISETV